MLLIKPARPKKIKMITVTLSNDPFSNWDSFIQQPFTNGVGTTIQSAMSAIQGPLTALVVLWIIVSGILVMRGDIGVRTGVVRILSTSIVVAILMSATLYNEYVVSFFTEGLPNFIGTALGNGTATTEPDTFYQIFINTQKVFVQANKGVSSVDIAAAVLFAILDALSVIPTIVLFLFYELTKILMDLVVCLGPFVLPGYLFSATKGVADRFVSKLIGLSVLIVLIDILLSIIDGAINTYCGDVVAMITSGQSSGWFGTSEDIGATLIMCIQLVIFLFISMLLMTFIPGIASFIGGGVSVSPLAMANAAANVRTFVSPNKASAGRG
jgi:type IV secretion system protein VirB6